MRRMWKVSLAVAIASSAWISASAQGPSEEIQPAPEPASEPEPVSEPAVAPTVDAASSPQVQVGQETEPTPAPVAEQTAAAPVALESASAVPPNAPSEPASNASVELALPTAEPDSAAADDQTEYFAELSLAELMNTPVTVATTVSQPLSSTPGIVAIVTRDQIERSGARDLLDILHQVPGFTFAIHVASSVGPMVRGNWAHEGKFLLLVDGIEMNETLYLTNQFGNHLPASIIDRVEIIRGPGSVVYGGYAELAVVSVHTRRAERLGAYSEVSAVYGQRETGFARRGVALLAGHKSDAFGGTEVTLSTLLWGQGTRSEEKYTDFSGNSISLKGNSQLDANHINFGLKIQKFKARLIFDRPENELPDGQGPVDLSASVPSQDFETWGSSMEYQWDLTDSLSITPRLSYKRQRPWRVTEEGAKTFMDKTAHRLVAGLLANWSPLKNLTILGGGNFTKDRAILNDPNDANVGFNVAYGVDDAGRPITSTGYTNAAGFLSADYKAFLTDDWNLGVTVGGRFERHSAYGTSFVPRAALNMGYGDGHLKVQYARAFQAPGIEAINLTKTDIRPTRTTTYEVELGYLLFKKLLVTANVFDIDVRRPIIYFYDAATNVETYRNVSKMGSRGVEAEAKLDIGRGYVYASYSYYNASGRNTLDSYGVEGRSGPMLGAPQHKVTGQASFDVTRDMSVNAGLIHLGKNYVEDGSVERAMNLINLGIVRHDVWTKGLDVSIYAYNLLQEPYRFVQPDGLGHAPLPGLGREIALQAAYRYESLLDDPG